MVTKVTSIVRVISSISMTFAESSENGVILKCAKCHRNCAFSGFPGDPPKNTEISSFWGSKNDPFLGGRKNPQKWISTHTIVWWYPPNYLLFRYPVRPPKTGFWGVFLGGPAKPTRFWGVQNAPPEMHNLWHFGDAPKWVVFLRVSAWRSVQRFPRGSKIQIQSEGIFVAARWVCEGFHSRGESGYPVKTLQRLMRSNDLRRPSAMRIT